jgi:hypothetical protein
LDLGLRGRFVCCCASAVTPMTTLPITRNCKTLQINRAVRSNGFTQTSKEISAPF